MKPSFIRSVLAVLFISTTAHAQCPGDVIPNGVVNGTDLAEVLASWGPCSSCNADTNGDGQVNGQDLAAVLGGWGPCRPIITSISPNQGHIDGGALITISGQYLSGTTAVVIGGAPASAVTVLSDSSVRATTPPGVLGSTTVSVTTPAGTTAVADAFSYVQIGVPSWGTLLQAEPDPSVVTDSSIRASIAATGYAWRVRHTATQIEMALVPAGSFVMGCTPSGEYSCAPDESPIRTVVISTAFYVSQFEVTQSQWQGTMGYNPSYFQGRDYPNAAQQPVEQVSWESIQSFLHQTDLRLLTEAEWEYAYRAGTTTAFHGTPSDPSGLTNDDSVSSIGWFSGNNAPFYGPKPVGQLAGNGFGLHDMAGNVREYVSDWYSPTYYTSGDSTDPTGPPSGSARVLRGGGSGSNSNECRASHRAFQGSVPFDGWGFRVARNP